MRFFTTDDVLAILRVHDEQSILRCDKWSNMTPREFLESVDYLPLLKNDIGPSGYKIQGEPKFISAPQWKPDGTANWAKREDGSEFPVIHSTKCPCFRKRNAQWSECVPSCICYKYRPNKPRKSMIVQVQLGAYQSFEFVQEKDLGYQYTNGGKAPRSIVGRLTTAMDEPFVNRTVTVLLSEKAQRDLIAALLENLNGKEQT